MLPDVFSAGLARRRLELARAMLSGGDTTALDVAMKCGYGTYTAFYVAFRKATGLSPSNWRKGPKNAKGISQTATR